MHGHLLPDGVAVDPEESGPGCQRQSPIPHPHKSDAATVRLEELWNERIADYELCLLCAYHVDPVDVELRRGIYYKVLPVPEPSSNPA